ncbi:MAG: bifunctional 5,10-methylenetetrahydrofolate dehydrogenase/5,10-methenyltetrahydrofolate cyclohydrolase [Candidatus Cloacimonetes bacterium]|nr:bifunctional 5,10-methylenetetrahydrofolate dehydrogenase/5,10-methenyltetrahydrofolate cyclohydrolase [Candidatus Cloacimonadota bacterium]
MFKELRAKPITKILYKEITDEIKRLNITPKLVIILVGNDPASEYYISSVTKKAKKVGIKVELKKFNDTIIQSELINFIEELNTNEEVDGIMIQKPLPSQINDDEISEKINPDKDVDAFHAVNMGNLILDKSGFLPCTPAAILEIFKFYKIELEGKHVVVIGRSNIVGKPIANLLLRKNIYANATVTICHSKTKNISEYTKKADILIATIGKANYITNDMVSKNTVIIDVGINLIIDKDVKSIYVGDVDYNSCYNDCLAITPVPGGVGSITTAILLKNVIYANKIKKRKNFVDEK